MGNQSTYSPDINELIFANKNKGYGAYILRKSYDASLSFAMWIVILFFILLTSAPLIYKLIFPGKDIHFHSQRAVEVLLLSEPPSIVPSSISKPTEITAPVVSNKNLTAPTVKSDELVNSDFLSKADTAGLENIYSETTLDVQIKYPYGWTYIDQNAKNRLDGVTFWSAANQYNPPPYVHLEVMDKDLFNPSRFKYKSEFENYTIYYNDPEELSGQYSRLIYIRTETDVDYSLKLIMKGKEQFENFEPVFFGMLKTFSFGD